MTKTGVDKEALIAMFAEASAKQGEALRKAVSEATLRALKGRQFTIDNIRKVVKTSPKPRGPVSPATRPRRSMSKGCSARRSAASMRRCCRRSGPIAKALEQFVSAGTSLSEKPHKEALANIERKEDVFFATITKARQLAGPLQGRWQSAPESFRSKGSATGSQAAQTVETLLGLAQTTLREGGHPDEGGVGRCSTATRRWRAAR